MCSQKLSISNIHIRQGNKQESVLKSSGYKNYKSQKRRLYFISFCFLSAFSLITFRLFQTMAFSDPKFLDYHQAETLVEQRMKADILDRNGNVLATSLKTASAFIDPRYIYDAEIAAHNIASILPSIDKKKLYQDLKSDKKFFWLKRNITPEEHYKLHNLGYPGLQFKVEEKRLYPFGRKAAHIIGLTDVDGHGVMGAERAFENQLLESDQSISLSIDIRLQHILHQEVEKTIADFDAVGGAGLMLNAKTGEVLSLISFPDFHPEKPLRRGDEKKLFNKITQGNYEHGSSFKILNTAYALDSGRVNISDEYDARRPLRVGKYTIKDFYPKSKIMTVPEVFIHSSNIGSVLMVKQAGIEDQKKFFQKLGYLETLTTELVENTRPLLPATWRDINGYTISYGYGMAVSPLQLAHGVSTVVNGGYKVKPTVLKQDNPLALEAHEQIISENTSKMMRQIMRLSVDIGCSKGARTEGYGVIGKTGTAEKLSGGSYDHNERVSSFIGAFPADDPEYVLLVMIDQPRGNKSTYGFATGGWVAAPAAGRIIKKMAPLLDLRPENSGKAKPNELVPNQLINVLYQQAGYRVP